MNTALGIVITLVVIYLSAAIWHVSGKNSCMELMEVSNCTRQWVPVYEGKTNGVD